jgi:hypothetical protein
MSYRARYWLASLAGLFAVALAVRLLLAGPMGIGKVTVLLIVTSGAITACIFSIPPTHRNGLKKTVAVAMSVFLVLAAVVAIKTQIESTEAASRSTNSAPVPAVVESANIFNAVVFYNDRLKVYDWLRPRVGQVIRLSLILELYTTLPGREFTENAISLQSIPPARGRQVILQANPDDVSPYDTIELTFKPTPPGVVDYIEAIDGSNLRVTGKFHVENVDPDKSLTRSYVVVLQPVL